MPRIYISYRDENGVPTGGGDPEDFCSNCWPPTVEDIQNLRGKPTYRHLTEEQIGEDIDDQAYSDGHGAEHPPYVECDYDCAMCGERLTEEDD